MNLNQDRRFHSYNNIRDFFREHGVSLATAAPALTDEIAAYNLLFDRVDPLLMDINENCPAATVYKKQYDEECRAGVWNLTIVMQFYYAKTNNDVAATSVKISESRFKGLSEKAFYTFGQTVLNDYEPAIYTPLGIVEADIVALKTKMLDYPNEMRAGKQARQRRKNASDELDEVNREMRKLLKTRIEKLLLQARTMFYDKVSTYRKLSRIGNVRRASGKAPHEGNIAEGQIKPVDKQTYRRKRALIVKNTGTTPLMGGIGTADNAFTGTPFLIPPGKTIQRISLKLAAAGEFFLIQNMGEGDGKYEVWIKE